MCNKTEMWDAVYQQTGERLAWDVISLQSPEIVPEAFLNTFVMHVNWTLLSMFYPFSIDLLRQLSHKVNWFYMYKCKQIPSWIIEEFEYNYRNNKGDNQHIWFVISRFQNLTEPFILKYHKMLHMDQVTVSSCFRLVHSELFLTNEEDNDTAIYEEDIRNVGYCCDLNLMFLFLSILLHKIYFYYCKFCN